MSIGQPNAPLTAGPSRAEGKAAIGRLSRGELCLYLAAVLALPVLVLWHQDNSLFTAPGQIDSWFYLGYFRNLLNFKRDLFPGTYYGSRLAWILPGWLVHWFFSPLVGDAILHLAVISAATLSLFTTLHLTVGARRAFLTTLVFSANPQLWYAAGSDYLDGMGVAWCLIAMALVTRAAQRSGRIWSLMFAGVAIAGLVYSNYFYVAFTPLLPLYYAGLARRWRLTPITRLLLDLGLWGGTGFLAATMALCAVNYRLDGTLWFYGPSTRAASVLINIHQWYRSPWILNSLAPWLWLPCVAGVCTLALLPSRYRRRFQSEHTPALLFSAQFGLMLAQFVYFQYGLGMAPLGVPYYASILLPFTFLTIGSSFWGAAGQLSRGTYLAFCCIAALAFAAIWSDYSGKWTPVWPTTALPMAVAAAVALTAALVLSNRAAGILLAIAGFACLTAEVRYIPNSQHATDVPAARPTDPHAYRHDFERLMDVRDRIETVRRNHAVRFWYDETDPASFDFVALNSTYLYEYSMWRKPFLQTSCDPILPSTVFVISSRWESGAAAAIAAISDCAHGDALHPSLVSRWTTTSPYGPYVSAILTMERDPQRWHLLYPEFDSTGKGSVRMLPYQDTARAWPLAQWTPLYPELHTELRSVAGGIDLRSPSVRHAGAAAYGPFTAPASGRYRFTLRYQLQSGEFAFGVRAGDGIAWLVTDIVGHYNGTDLERDCWVDLDAGQTFSLEIANNNSKADVPVSLLIKEVTALESDRPNPR